MYMWLCQRRYWLIDPLRTGWDRLEVDLALTGSYPLGPVRKWFGRVIEGIT